MRRRPVKATAPPITAFIGAVVVGLLYLQVTVRKESLS
jgi:hypothetical protein